MNRGSEDEAWRAIVENFGERARLDDGRDDLYEGRERDATVDSADPSDPGDGEDADRGDGTTDPGDSGRDDGVDLARIAELTGAGAPIPDTDLPPELREEAFVPPPPPPLPRPTPQRLVAWLGVLGVPVLLLVLLLVQTPPPPWAVTGMVIWFLSGFAYLVALMPSERPDDGDNGARV